jgi:hypothetical protein
MEAGKFRPKPGFVKQFLSVDFHRTLRHGAEKRAAVGLRKDATIEDHNRAGIGLAADETADALAKFENCLRE